MKTPIAALLFLALATTGCEKERFINEEGNLVPKTVDLDASLPNIYVNGTHLHAEAFGSPSDPLLVVLHGGPGGDYRSLLNCKAFADSGYYVVFYDQRGSGLSRREKKDAFTTEVMSEDLAAIIDHYRSAPAQKVFLLGHSWGAILASIYVNEHPTAVDGLILCEPGGLKWQDIVDYVARVRDFTLTDENLNDATYIDQFLTGDEDQQAILDYKMGLQTVSDGDPGSPIGNEGMVPIWRCGAVVNRALFDLGERDKPDWTTYLHSYAKPVLFIYSENNRAYGAEHALHVSAPYSDVRLERIDNAGHDMLSFPTGFAHFFPKALDYLHSL